MHRKILLFYLVVVAALLFMVWMGNDIVMRILSSIPVIGDMISSDVDARTRIIAAQKNLALSGGVNSEVVREWERRYVATRDRAEMKRIVKDSGPNAEQIKEMMERFHSKFEAGGSIDSDDGTLVEGSPIFFKGMIYVSDETSVKSREVFLVAIIGELLEWQKTIGLVNESVIVENPDEKVTIWVSVDADAARDIYTAFENNASKSELYDRVVEYSMEGRIQISPFNMFMEFAQQYI